MRGFVGGFDLAAEWMGWRTIWVSEIDPYASAVLAHRFPEAPNLGDITAVEWSAVERPNVLCGGFPCQPHSTAGERKASDDDRDLWAECVRCVRELRPDYAVFENVPGLFTSERGGFFNRVLSSVADLGYDAEWSVLSAQTVGAPHVRDRIWILCYPQRERLQVGVPLSRSHPSPRYPKWPTASLDAQRDAVAWLDGLVESESPLLRNTDGIPHRLDRLHALGNAIVPACAVEGPFKRIMEMENARFSAGRSAQPHD